MSKRSSTSNNTLLNYFTRSPSVTNSPSTSKQNKNDSTVKDETPKKPKPKQNKHRRLSNGSDEEVQPKKRRKRIIQPASSDDTDDEHNESTPTKLQSFAIKGSAKKGKRQEEKSSEKSHSLSNNNTSITFLQKDKTNEESTWFHLKLNFLLPNNIKDKHHRNPSHPDYDHKTLRVPSDFIAKQTPAMAQWWKMKSENYNCLLLFKVGKFYELYHMDAIIGVNELGLTLMKGDFAHSGFPESAYGKMSSLLIDLGYKVARIEQVETPEAMAAAVRAGSKQKVVKREICQISDRATRVQNIQDFDVKEPQSFYLLAICQRVSSNNQTEFGVCFIDTLIGTFHIGQFMDDCHYSRLLTLVAQYPPAVILQERNQLSEKVKKLFMPIDVKFESLNAESQFYSATETLSILKKKQYFNNENSNEMEWPEVLKTMISDDDPINISHKPEYEYALRSLGACLWYLERCLLDIQLLMLKKFELYLPADMQTNAMASQKFMVLDAFTLTNLNLLDAKESLHKTIDHCCTPFGKRLLRHWICRPLNNIEQIIERQDAVNELLTHPNTIQEFKEILSNLPDLERLIAKIHFLGNPLRAKNHPDSRASFYEQKSYSKRKVNNFIIALDSFDKVANIGDLFQDFKSPLIRKNSQPPPEGLYPNMCDTLTNFKNSFNMKEAEKEGKIIPEYGLDKDYDDSVNEINTIKKKLDAYLISQEKKLGCKLSYFGTDKKRYQIEVPEHVVNKVPSNYFFQGSRKGFKRYVTDETKKLLADMTAAETTSKEILQDINRRIFEKFSAKYDDWSKICNCLATLDALMSLMTYIQNQNINMCFPKLLPPNENNNADQQNDVVEYILNSVHPCVSNIETFVPNDIHLGDEGNERLLILTGPNMGGKSTLMRQVALLTILAQIGCQVPASKMALTIVDRVFTRLGSNDDIMAAQSTFMVECSEAQAILKHASVNSLVLVDELGRGTSTYDGTAIASAYVDELARIRCRGIFSTHYYNLIQHFLNQPVQLGHMACKVTKDENDSNEEEEIVTFTYRLASGACPKSYGFNVACLAGFPSFIIKRARQNAEEVHERSMAPKIFRKIFTVNESELQKLFSAL